MSETTVELSNQNDLFGNLFTGTRPPLNNFRFHAADTDSVQSEISEKEGENNLESIAFQEILGQHIISLTTRDAVNLHKPSHPARESSAAKLLQEDSNGINTAVLPETPPTENLQRNAKNPNILIPFEGGIDGFLPVEEKGEKELVPNISGKKLSDATTQSANIPAGITSEHVKTINQNFSASPFPKEGVREVNMQKSTVSPPHRNLSPSLRIETAEWSAGVSQNPENLQKPDQSISGAIQETEFTGSYKPGAISELPPLFKSQAQDVSTKNRLAMPLYETNNRITVTEKTRENDLAEINSKAPSVHDVSGVSQTREEWNSFNNFTHEQNLFNPPPHDTHMQKTPSRHPFPFDIHITTDGIPSHATTPPHNTEISPLGGPIQPVSSEGRKDKLSHPFHGNSTAGTEQTYTIMDQLIKKISLIHTGDKSEIMMHLTPPELGSVKIHFTEENDEIEAKIFVENAEIKAVIENNAHRLKESVAANGVDIHKLEVHIQNNDAHKQKSSENHDPNKRHFQMQNEQDKKEGQSFAENVSSNLHTEIGINPSTLTVDYII